MNKNPDNTIKYHV